MCATCKYLNSFACTRLPDVHTTASKLDRCRMIKHIYSVSKRHSLFNLINNKAIQLACLLCMSETII